MKVFIGKKEFRDNFYENIKKIRVLIPEQRIRSAELATKSLKDGASFDYLATTTIDDRLRRAHLIKWSK